MSDFGIILCSDIEESGKEKTINSITNKIKNVLKGKKIELKVNQIELYKNFNMFFISLQESEQSLADLKDKHLQDIHKTISDICTQNNIKQCIIPRSFPEKFINEKCIKSKFSGQYLYTSLIWNIIYDLFSGSKKDTDEIEVAIISGNNDEKLWAITDLLLAKIKYLTIITENKDYLMERADKIYEETGLSIRLAADGKNAFKDMDLIINLNNNYELKSSYKLKNDSIIINYSDIAANWSYIENIIVNNINIDVPWDLKNKIDTNLLKSFNYLELSEIILSYKRNIDDEILGGLYNYGKMQIMAKEFNNDKFTIGGYYGRRGFLKKIV